MSVCLALWESAPVLQREKLQLVRPLQYCRQRQKLQLLRPQYHGREREILQIPRPLKYCKERERNCNDWEPSSMAERETASTARDSETADSEDLKNHAFLKKTPYSGSKGFLVVPTEGRKRKTNFRSQALHWERFRFKTKTLIGKAFGSRGKQTLEAKPFIGKAFECFRFKTKTLIGIAFGSRGKQTLEAKPFIGKALDSKGQQTLETKQVLLYYYCTTTVRLLYYYCTTVLLLYYCCTTIILLYYRCTTTVLPLYDRCLCIYIYMHIYIYICIYILKIGKRPGKRI